jgi:hypothetical protein
MVNLLESLLPRLDAARGRLATLEQVINLLKGLLPRLDAAFGGHTALEEMVDLLESLLPGLDAARGRLATLVVINIPGRNVALRCVAVPAQTVSGREGALKSSVRYG